MHIEITRDDQLLSIEEKIAGMSAPAVSGKDDLFSARLSSDRRASYFKDIWIALAVAKGLDSCHRADITAWGLQNWGGRDDEDAFALSHACLLAFQRGAGVFTESKPPVPLPDKEIRRYINSNHGVVGVGGRQRTIVEFDPDYPVAAVLDKYEMSTRDAFFDFIIGVLARLEINGRGHKQILDESDYKYSVIKFLFELHSNAYEHGRAARGVRLMRLQKHQFPDRDRALPRAAAFEELTDYLCAQPPKPSGFEFNLVEASVSDFGPGIIDGFLSSHAGRAFRKMPRRDVLYKVLHEQLSSKSGDQSAGLGIRQALVAASGMGAFVSLRTDEFWLTMSGGLDRDPLLGFRRGVFPKVAGTHWQFLLPDRPIDKQLGFSFA